MTRGGKRLRQFKLRADRSVTPAPGHSRRHGLALCSMACCLGALAQQPARPPAAPAPKPAASASAPASPALSPSSASANSQVPAWSVEDFTSRSLERLAIIDLRLSPQPRPRDY